MAQTLPPPVALSHQYWGTIYYPWYGHWTHWDESGHSPPSTWASMYLPDKGDGVYNTQNMYSSKDTTVLNRHLTEMDRAILDFALVSWWGQNSDPDKAFRLLLQQASSNSSLRVKLGIYYEIESNSDPTVSQIVNDLTYIYDQYTSSSGFFKVSDGANQYPVVFVFAGANDNLNYTNRWAQARAQMYAVGKPVFIVLKVWATTTDSWRNHARDVDSWHQYAPALQYELQSDYSAFASPSYWEYPELAIARGRADPNQPLLDRNSTNFASAVRNLANLSLSQAQFLLIETFNEFHEGSMIEPAIQINHVESGFSQAKSSYGFTYIDIVRDRGTNTPPPPPNNPPSLQQIQSETVNELTRLTFTVSGSDTDGDTLTYSATDLPDGSTFNSTTRTFDWTPSETQGPGDYTVIFKVTDNGSPSLSSTETVMIHVLETNTRPSLGFARDITVNNGTIISFKFNATDPDFPIQPLSFSLLNPPTGASLTSSGQFVWDTSNTQPGIYVIAVSVSDGSLAQTVQFRVTVVPSQTPMPEPLAESPAPNRFILTTSTLVPIIFLVAAILLGSLFLVGRRNRPGKAHQHRS